MSKKRWLHISDLHFGGGENAEWVMLQKELAFPKIDFLVFTGDLHDFTSGSFEVGLKFIQYVMEKYKLTAKNVFMVPGNHDVNFTEEKESGAFKEFAAKRLGEIKNSRADVLDRKGEPLTERFSDYCDAVGKIYGENTFPFAGVFCREWGGRVNIIHLNTALLSNSNTHMEQIVDTTALAALEPKNPRLPAVVLAHHNFYEISKDQKELLKDLFQRLNVRAYLHGDLHQQVENSILLRDGREIPCIAAPSIYRNPADSHAETGAYLYEWDLESPQGKVKIIPYVWAKRKWTKGESIIGSFDMQDIEKGLWETEYNPRLGWLEPGILPGIIYQPQGEDAVREEYHNAGGSGWPPMVELFQRHENEKYFQLVGKGKQACGGTGKTSTLLSVAAALTNPALERKKIIPLYFPLKELYGVRKRREEGKNRIIEYAKEHYKMEEGDRHPRTLFLLDGFNEIFTPSEQVNCLRDIQEVMKEQYPDDAVIITSRDPLDTYIQLGEYGEDFDRRQLNDWTIYFRNCYIQELSKEQKDKYIGEPKPDPDDHIWSILDTPFYLVMYNSSKQPISENAKRWLTPAFDRQVREGRPEKMTLMLQLMLREITRLEEGEEARKAERQSFFLMKVLPYLGYRQVLKDRLDQELSTGPKLSFKRLDVYRCTYACLTAYLTELDLWPEYRGSYADDLELAWGKFCALYENGGAPKILPLTDCVPYSTFLFGFLDYRDGASHFCHDNYRDFFAALHIANVVYLFSKGVELSTLPPAAREVFLLQLEVFDHSILLDAESILRQYFGLCFEDEASFRDLLEEQRDGLSRLALLPVLIRFLDADIQHASNKAGQAQKQLYRFRGSLYEQFKKQFEELQDTAAWIGQQYGQFYVHVLTMLARDCRTGMGGQRDLVKCAGYAGLAAQAEKAFQVPKADGYLQMGLCVNAWMEDLLNGKTGGTQLRIPYDFALAEKVYHAVRCCNAGGRDQAIRELRGLLFKNWSKYTGNPLACADIFELILHTAYQKYSGAADARYREITRHGFASKAYLVLAAIGTSGGALNTLAQMLINQANKMELDPRLNFFRCNPAIYESADKTCPEYTLEGKDHFALAYRLLRTVCGIKRGDQPYSHLKAAELILKGRVSAQGQDQWLESALNKAIGGDQAMGHYWKGRYYLNCAEDCADEKEKAGYVENAIACFRATEAAEFLYDAYLEGSLGMPADKWLSAIELLAFPQKVEFVSDRGQVYRAVLKALQEQVNEVRKDAVELKNEKYRLQKRDVWDNLTRFRDILCRHFSPAKARPVEMLLQLVSDRESDCVQKP